MSREVSVTGPFGPVPRVTVMVNVTLSVPGGTGVGKCRLAVSSSGTSTGTVPRSVSPALAETTPWHPALPVPQLTCREILCSASGSSAVDVTLSSEGNSLPVGVSSPWGSKHPSNSKSGLVTFLPCLSVMVRNPVSFDGPPAVKQSFDNVTKEMEAVRRRLGLGGGQGGGGGFGGGNENVRGRIGQLKGAIMGSTSLPTNTQLMQIREVKAALPQVIDQANAAPDDDTPRLVFADWLDERGTGDDHLRAELIRAQCRAASFWNWALPAAKSDL